jgi:hypothetical protein
VECHLCGAGCRSGGAGRSYGRKLRAGSGDAEFVGVLRFAQDDKYNLNKYK